MSKYNNQELQQMALMVLAAKNTSKYMAFIFELRRRTGMSYSSLDARITALAAGL